MEHQNGNTWVLLDAMGVIFPVGDDVAELLVPFVFERSGTPAHVVEAHYLEATLGHRTSKSFWEAVGLGSDYPAVEREYLDQNFRLNVGLEETLKRLEASSINMGLVSNDVTEWSRRLRAMYDLDRWLRCVIISGEVGYRKPNPRIYEAFLSSASAAAADCVAVDDRPTNLRTASSLGIGTILFDPSSSFHWPGTRVESFYELPAAVNAVFSRAEG